MATTVFGYTGANQSFVVPANVNRIRIKAWGAGGGAGNAGTSNGGPGGYSEGLLDVTPGETLIVIVGQGGIFGSIAPTYGGGGAGGDDTSTSNLDGASGGGRSAVRRSSLELITAGGGGGAGRATALTFQNSLSNGGSGGGLIGTNAYTQGCIDVGGLSKGGAGGTQAVGGAGGTGSGATGGGIGNLFTGGGGGSTSVINTGAGGGGGGGYFGGGGGAGQYTSGGVCNAATSQEAAGGGGSSYIGGVTSGLTLSTPQNTSSSNASPLLNPPNTADTYYVAGTGIGGRNGGNGGNGLVVITAEASFVVTKTDNPDPVIAGNTLSYTITVTNNGPSDADTVQVIDVVPTCIPAPTFTVGGVPQGAWTGSYTVGSMALGASIQIVISGRVDPACPAGLITNTAVVTSATPDPTPTNRVVTITTQVNTSADLSIAKTDNPDPVIAGQVLTYTITVTNSGPSDAQTVQLTDTLPACLTNAQYQIDLGGYGPWPGGAIALGTIAPGTPVVVDIQGTIDPSCLGAISNTATVASPTPDPTPTNRTTTIDTQVEALADLLIIKTDDPDPVIAGELLTYTLNITNNGPSDARNVALTDVVDTCITNPEFSVDGGPWNSWSGGPYPLGTLDMHSLAGATVTVRVRGIVDSGCLGTISNTATVTSQTPTLTPGNRTATIDTQVDASADLVIIKTDNPDPVIAGELLTYTLTVTNNGPSDAQSVDLTDAVDPCVTNPEYSTDGFHWESWDGGPYVLGTLKSGATVTVRIRGIIDPVCSVPITNTATVTSPTPDPTPDNRTTMIDTQIDTRARLSVTKADSKDPVIAGELLTYTITVTNSGPSDAQMVALTDVVDACVTSPEFQIDGGGWNAWGGGPEPLGNMAPGDMITVEIKGIIDPACVGTMANTATVTSITPDLTPSKRTTTINTQINALADLRITKIDTPDPVIAGEMLTYNLAVINNGPSDALDVKLIDAVPLCVMAPEYSTDGGANWNPWPGTLRLGTMIPTATANVSIRGMIDPSWSGQITNKATLESPTPARDPNDRTTSQNTTIRAIADLTITKTANPDPVATDALLTYTIVITNAGPSTAANSGLLDAIPTCIVDPTYSLDGVTWLTWTGVLPMGNILPTKTITVLIRGLVDKECTGLITNTATITSPTPTTRPEARSATITTPIISLANISITKIANVTTVSLDDIFFYTVNLLNKGGTNAFNVLLKDQLSPATVLVENSITVDGVTVNKGDFKNGVNVGTITPGQQVVVKYGVRVVGGVSCGKIENEAYAKYYKLMHTNRCCPAETEHVTAVVDSTITNFKQLNMNHTFKLPCGKPPIEDLEEATSEIEIRDYYVVDVPKSISIEGQRLSGFKLVIHGILKVAINYMTGLQEQSLHAVSWEMPFSTFIILPVDYVQGQVFEVSAVIENTEASLFGEKMIDVDVTVLLVARRG